MLVTVRLYPRGRRESDSVADLLPGAIGLVVATYKYLHHRIGHRGAWMVEVPTDSEKTLATRVAHDRASARELFAETCRRVPAVGIDEIETALRVPES